MKRIKGNIISDQMFLNDLPQRVSDTILHIELLFPQEIVVQTGSNQ